MLGEMILNEVHCCQWKLAGDYNCDIKWNVNFNEVTSSGFDYMSSGQSIKGTKSDSGAAKRKRKKADELLTSSMTGSILRFTQTVSLS